MADTTVQLPPNSTGQQIRIETGDATNLIPAGVGEEVVMLSDARGVLVGDARSVPFVMESPTLDAIYTELRIIRELLGSVL